MGHLHERRYPGESDAYRAARDRLLEAERALRRQTEEVAALRRALPEGGAVKEDYVFEEGAADLSDATTVSKTRLSELFAAGRDTLVLYSLMYPPGGSACPMCTAFLDALDGNAVHLSQRINLAIVAKAPVETIRTYAASRGWTSLRLLSSGGNSYNTDYFAESPDGAQLPMLNVFRRGPDGIRHTYGSELFMIPSEPGQHPRHIDPMWPLWNVLDMTPDGRGSDWYPQIS